MSNIFTYQEFLERYLINKEEFYFTFNNLGIWLCGGSKKNFAVTISFKNEALPIHFEFDNQDDILNSLLINGKSIKDSWDNIN